MLQLLTIAPVLGLFIELGKIWDTVETTVIFVVIGLIVFAISFLIIVFVAPFSVKKEIEDDQNTSLAIIIGAVIIGVAMIISAAVHS